MLNNTKQKNIVNTNSRPANIHKKKLWKTIFLILMLGLLVQACSKKANSPNLPVVQEHFLNGDPIVFVQKTTNNSKSFFTKENIQSFNGFKLVGINQFVEKTDSKEVKVKDMEEAKEKNKTTSQFEKSNNPDTSTYQMTKRSIGSNDEYVFEPSADHPDTPKLVLRSSAVYPDTLELQAIEKEDAKLETHQKTVQTIHYSISPDQSRFSVLVYSNFGDESGKTLAVIYFAKPLNKPVEIKVNSEENIYVFGPGFPIGWNQGKPVELTLCGIDSYRYYDEIQAGMSLWQEPLEKRLEIQKKYSFGKKCPPFSDVNVHGLYFIDQHRLSDSDTIITPAVAQVIPDISRAEITDADIFIFKEEYMGAIKKANPALTWEDKQVDKYLTSLQLVVGHEFGHFLGLGHKFDGTRSIMAYGDESTKHLTNYDTKVIQELYPLKANP